MVPLCTVAPKLQAAASIDATLDPDNAPPAASFIDAQPGARQATRETSMDL